MFLPSKNLMPVVNKQIKTKSLRPIGDNFDLNIIFNNLNKLYFHDSIEAAITFGKCNKKKKKKKSLLLGSYNYSSKLITINPVLDNDFVPMLVVQRVLHHEMLHQKHPPQILNKRRIFHSKKFKEEENIFIGADKADVWIKQNIDRLLVL